MYADYRTKNDFVGMDIHRKFLEMSLLGQDDMHVIETAINTISNGNVKLGHDAMTALYRVG